MNSFSEKYPDCVSALGLIWFVNHQISSVMAKDENVRVASFQIINNQLVWVQPEKAIEEHHAYTKVSKKELEAV